MTLSFTQQVDLANDPAFIKRVRQAIVKAALAISAEQATADADLDAARLRFATAVLRDPDRYARIMACGLATAEGVTDKAADNDLSNNAAAQWNAYAGAKPSS